MHSIKKFMPQMKVLMSTSVVLNQRGSPSQEVKTNFH